MSAAHQPGSISLPRWQWPVALDTYDRQPTLRADERVLLAQLDQSLHTRQVHARPRLRQGLRRLTQPLEDALGVLAIDSTRQLTTIHALLQHSFRRQVAFWGWTTAEWATMFSTEMHEICRYPAFGVAYLLCGLRDLQLYATPFPSFARRVFGAERVATAVAQLRGPLQTWGYDAHTLEFSTGLCYVLLINGSPYLEDLTAATLERIQRDALLPRYRWVVGAMSRALATLGILAAPLPPLSTVDQAWLERVRTEGIAPEWAALCQRWYATSTLELATRQGVRNALRQVGRWLTTTHPQVTHPQAWTRELAAEYVAAVDRMQNGDWAHPDHQTVARGAPASPASKRRFLYAMRTFIRDCQDWGWIPTHFNPHQCFAVPRAIRAGAQVNPRVIADDVWAKLLHAGLNLTEADLPRSRPDARTGFRYPLALVRAIALVWLFAGLRNDEIRRLRVGCVRWYQQELEVTGTGETLPKDAVCLLDVPVNKTSGEFTKPVDRYVGLAIAAWEQVRPPQPPGQDRKTGEAAQFLFSYRGQQMGKSYVNHALIPLLCQKAGVPLEDARGSITSHRARSTIASQLYNAKEPMSLPELQVWLGHKNPSSTQHYTKIAPTKLAKSYHDAEYFSRNVRTIAVLIDQQAIMQGDATQGVPWKYYDLGHGYCTYDFFEQCEHRMACAQCAFYRPKNAFLELLREKQGHLLHMQQAIPLTEIELATVEGDLVATERLIGQLTNVPTPPGPTPRQLEAQRAPGKQPLQA